MINLASTVLGQLTDAGMGVETKIQMSENGLTRDTMSLEEATISNMWEFATMVEGLERKDLCTEHDLYEIIVEFRDKNPRASIPETASPLPYLLTKTENTIIDDILELLNKHGLTTHESRNLLERLGWIIEIGQPVVKVDDALTRRYHPVGSV